jgi:hypothetical protein
MSYDPLSAILQFRRLASAGGGIVTMPQRMATTTLPTQNVPIDRDQCGMLPGVRSLSLG